MKINFELGKKQIIIFLAIIILILASYGIYYFLKNSKAINSKGKKINQNISKELKELPNNLYVFIPRKNSFILPDGFRYDDQTIDQGVLMFPSSQTNINYKNPQSLQSFQGILLFSSPSNFIQKEDFKSVSEKYLETFKANQSHSDAKGEFSSFKEDNQKYTISQRSPYRFVDTLLQTKYLIEVMSADNSLAYKQIIDTYSTGTGLPDGELSKIIKLRNNFILALKNKNSEEILSLFSDFGKKKTNTEQINEWISSVSSDFVDQYYSTGLLHHNDDFILTSRFQYNKDKMKRFTIFLEADFDGQNNNWSINSLTIEQEEKFLPSDPNWEENAGEIKLK